MNSQIGIAQKPERHPKGWGYEDWIVNSEKYCGKMLFFKQGKRCSAHYHKRKDETFYLESGALEVALADSPEAWHSGKRIKILLCPGDTLYIWPRRIHQMIALKDSRLFEFSTQHFEEDSYRLERGD